MLLFLSALAAAGPAVEIPQIGEHQPILTVEKNVHPENAMVIYTKTDEQCRFVKDPKKGHSVLVDFYWLMDRKFFKPVHQLIKNRIREALEVDAAESDRPSEFAVKLHKLEEVKTDIEDPTLTVQAKKEGGQCKVEGHLQLGPSDNHAEIRVDSLYTEGRTFPPVLHSVTLKGVDLKTGMPVARTYRAK